MWVHGDEDARGVMYVPPASAPPVPQMMRSQSASQIWKHAHPNAVTPPVAAEAAIALPAERSTPLANPEPRTKRSAPASPDESPIKRSQSALQVSKMARTVSCGRLADLDAPPLTDTTTWVLRIV